jgi:signal transduction histidine kinase/ActR/RegA family two-component response regulator
MALAFDEDISAQQVADILPIGLAILNDQDELVSVNHRLRELIECSNTKFSECWLPSIHSEDCDRVATRYREAAGSKRSLRVEYRTRSPECMWHVATLSHLDDTNVQRFNLGDNAGFICTIVDITPEKKAELSQVQIAQEAEARKQQQERFIDMISHEIRNPLSSVLHCTEDILEAMHGKKKEILVSAITEAAETINLCIAHQEKIVNDVLLFSKLDASMLTLSPRRVQPKRYLTTPLAILRPEFGKQNIQYEYELDSSYAECQVDWVMADLDRMSQVMINLLSNAIKFTAKSENERIIKVSLGASMTRPSSYPPNVVFFGSDEAGLRLDATGTAQWGDDQVVYIMVAIKDTGIGITEQGQKRLFERFKQATPRTQGTYGGSGLGLNLSRKICHLHGGEIGVSSKDGEGSTFSFFFKVHRSLVASNDDNGKYGDSRLDKLCSDSQATEGSLASNHKSLPEHDDDGTANRHILLVEDNDINRRIISRRLKSLGFQISEAGDGQEALNIAQRNELSCILMDQEMPVMDGNSATRAIRNLEKDGGGHIPILGVTANVRAEQQAEMLEAGMDDVILKPYRTNDIFEKINRLIASKVG